MPFIEVDGLVREFRSHKRFGGPFGTFRTLFTREYDVHRALDGINFTIDRGEAVGYVGPNGAGKSTTVKILTGILVPTQGVARVGGRVPHLHRTQNALQMGVVFGQRSQLWWDLPLRDSLELHRHVYRVPEKQFRRMLSFCEELLGIGDFRDFPVRQLSLGQRMRGELALALLHEPDVLFLDEPTIGLDVLVKDRVRSFLRQANRDFGVTILLTTHDLRDIEEICPRLLVIDQGRIVWDGTIVELKARFDLIRTLTLDFNSDPGPVHLEDAELVRDDGRHKSFRFDRRVTSAPRLLAEAMSRHSIEDAAIGEPDIEEVIRKLYADLGREQQPEVEAIDTWSRDQPLTR